MSFYFDHVFLLAPAGAPQADAIAGAGFTEGTPNVHPGQGTRNRRFFFPDGMLELLWCHNADEACSERTVRTRLYERAVGEACPFGVALSRHMGEARIAPFETWPYRPEYLPEDLYIPIAVASDDPALPLLFVMPAPARTPAFPDAPENSSGARGMARITLRGPGLGALDSAMDNSGRLAFEEDETPRLDIAFHGATRSGALDLRPQLPLTLHW